MKFINQLDVELGVLIDRATENSTFGQTKMINWSGKSRNFFPRIKWPAC